MLCKLKENLHGSIVCLATLELQDRNPDAVFDINFNHKDEEGDIYVSFRDMKSKSPIYNFEGFDPSEFGNIHESAFVPWVSYVGFFHAL